MLKEEQLDQILAASPEARAEFDRLLQSFRPQSRPRPERQRGNRDAEDRVVVPVEFTLPPLPESFQEIEPGTDLWIRYWKVHPEQQEEMLCFTKGGNDGG